MLSKVSLPSGCGDVHMSSPVSASSVSASSTSLRGDDDDADTDDADTGDAVFCFFDELTETRAAFRLLLVVDLVLVRVVDMCFYNDDFKTRKYIFFIACTYFINFINL